jgi:cell division ATPase FtsA
MASHPQTRGRENERRLSIRTLVIASIASLTAALITSRFWSAGTPIAAAVTPVLVSLVSEMLHRPTEKIAERLTSDAPVLGRSAPMRRAPERGRAEPGREQPPVPTHRTPVKPPPVDSGPVPVNVYKQPAPKRRRIAVGVALATGLLAFAIAAVVLTVPELIAGQSVGKSDRKSTYFGGRHRKATQDQQQETQQQTTPTQTETQTTDTTPEDKKKESTTPSQDRQNTTTQKTTSTQPRSPPGK